MSSKITLQRTTTKMEHKEELMDIRLYIIILSIKNYMNINNNFLYFVIFDFRTYGSLENTTAGGTPYPHSSFGARSRPSPSRPRLVSQCFRAH